MKKINLNRIFSLPTTRCDFQDRNGYCALGKLISEATGEVDLQPRTVYFFEDIATKVIDNPIAKHFFEDLYSKLSGKFVTEIATMNDKGETDKALKLLIQKAIECGVVELDNESLELSKELLTLDKVVV